MPCHHSVIFALGLCALVSACGVDDTPQPQVVPQARGACEIDGDCEGVGEGCVNGTCACVEAGCECTRDAECPGAQLCDVRGTCFEPECFTFVDSSCDNGELCIDGLCVTDLEADKDRDGVPDAQDNCPNDANADDGFADTDGDGRGDVCDDDDDGDGVDDGIDNCPLVHNSRQGDANGDGLGNLCDGAIRGTTLVGRLDLSAGGRPDPTTARIRLESEGLNAPASVEIDAQGGFVFDQALGEPGLIAISVEMAGFLPLGKVFTSTDTPEFDAGTFSLTPESDLSASAVTLRGRASLQGNQSHAGILVELKVGADTVSSTVTTPEGVFALLASRVDHTLRFSKEGFVPSDDIEVGWNSQATQFERGGVPLEDAEPTELRPLLDADFEGQLTTPIEGFPIRDAVVTLSGDVAQRLGVNEAGLFGTENQAPGLYRLDVSADGHRDVSTIVGLESGLTTLEPIVLEPIELALEGAVATVVEIEDEPVLVPLENVAVRLRRDGRLVVPATSSDEQGRFLFEVLPLSYTLSLSAANFLSVTYEVEFDGQDFIIDGEALGLDNPLVMIRAPESDRDSDGVIDLLDNCPDDFNPDLRDIDADGAGDACDPDADGDGMVNGLDNCPLSHNPMQEDLGGFGLGLACSEGTLESPLAVGFGLKGQVLNTRERSDRLQSNCGGAGAPDVAYRLPVLAGRTLSVRVDAQHPVVLYLLDQQGLEVFCTVGGRLNLPEDRALAAGVYTLVVDGFAGREAAGPIEVDIKTQRRATFTRGRDYATGQRAAATAIGDLDGDGHLDIVVANTDDDTVSVLIGDGKGQFEPRGDHSTSDAPVSVALGDLNGDDHLDIVTSNRSTFRQAASVLLGDGQGGFAAARHVDGTFPPGELVLSDMDADGHLDMVFGVFFRSFIKVLFGDGQGNFDAPEVSLETGGSHPGSLAVGDVNEDGHLDIVTANQGTDNISVFTGTGERAFSTHTLFPAGDAPTSLTMGDLNGDGHLDVVTVNEDSNDGRTFDATLMTGDGRGNFSPPRAFPLGALPGSVRLGDINGDRDLDIVAVNRGVREFPESVSVLLGDGQGNTTPIEPLTLGNGLLTATPVSVSLGDLNGDGLLDLVLANPAAGGITVLLPQHDKTFAPAQNHIAGDRIVDLVAGDLDEDDHIDLVTANDTADTLSILHGNGRGSFDLVNTLAVGDGPSSARLGDLDGDGHLDIVNGSCLADAIGIHRGNGQGDFQDSGALAAECPSQIEVADVNEDGHLDILAASLSGRDLRVWLNDGGGDFNALDAVPVGAAPSGLALGRLDGDDHLDLVVTNEEDHDISVLSGNGAGAFTEIARHPVGNNPRSVALADVNEDGHLDIITANFVINDVSVLLGDGQGNFGQHTTFPVGNSGTTQPRSVVVGDVDGDGHHDIVTANFQGDNLSVLRGDGEGGFATAERYPTGDGAFTALLADADEDGILDILVANLNDDDVSVLTGLVDNASEGTRLTRGSQPPCPPSTLEALRQPPSAILEFVFDTRAPCRIDRLEVATTFSNGLAPHLRLRTPRGLLQQVAVSAVTTGLWRPELTADLARVESHPLGGIWQLQAEGLQSAQMRVNTYPSDPFAPRTLVEACSTDLDQGTDPDSACRLPEGELSARLEDDDDEDVFLLEGDFGGAFIQGQTLSVIVETEPGRDLSATLRAFRARSALARAQEISEGRWVLSFTVPPEYSGRYFAVHVTGQGVSELSYTILAE